jgi:predicted DNA-binding transcriptional regulator AlpA
MSLKTPKETNVALMTTEGLTPYFARQMIAAEKDRIVRPKEAVIITGRSLASQWRDRKAGRWPQMYRIGENAVGNLLSDLLALNASREIVTAENSKPVAIGSKRGRKPYVARRTS